MTTWVLIIFIYQTVVVVPGSYADQGACLTAAKNAVLFGAGSNETVPKAKPLPFRPGVAAICVPAGDLPNP